MVFVPKKLYYKIREVCEIVGVESHVLRFWESRFAQVRPTKRAGGRRYYRPEDVDLLRGIRSLLSLTFLALVYGYFFDRKVWMRWVLLIASVPIAILANAFRVTMTGILSEYKREWADGFFHAAEGWVIFMLALIMLVGVHWFVSRAWRAAHEVEKPGAEG